MKTTYRIPTERGVPARDGPEGTHQEGVCAAASVRLFPDLDPLQWAWRLLDSWRSAHRGLVPKVFHVTEFQYIVLVEYVRRFRGPYEGPMSPPYAERTTLFDAEVVILERETEFFE